MKRNWRNLFSAATVLVALGFVAALPYQAGTAMAAPPSGDTSTPTVFLSITGDIQGEVVGGAVDPRCAGCMEVFGFSHELVSPRDAQSGLPTGGRQHKPLVITKSVDKSTPLLYNALVNNENISEFRLQFFRNKETVPYYTITLINASVAGIRTELSPGSNGPPRETLSFTYQKIIWTWEDGSISAEDDWEAPVA